jgi:hypothetical protein
MSYLKLFFIAIAYTFFCFPLVAQGDKTFAEKLGFPKGAKVVIFHVDDVGMSYDSNKGAIEAIENGVANSCSIMMTCSWVPDFFQYLKTHPNTDAGLHLTLTSEWKNYRWGPLAGKPAVPRLVDKEGALWLSVGEVVKNASADEVEKEIRAQIERSKIMGWKPTHLDSHMGTLFASPEFLERYIKVGIENKIPVMFPGGHAALIKKQTNFTEERMQQMRIIGKMLWDAGLPVLDDLHNESYEWKLPKEITGTDKNLRTFKTKKYMAALDSIMPGITMVIMHCTAPTEIFPYISDSGPTRKGDLLAMTDPQLKNFIKKKGIILTTWRELMQRRVKLK